MSFIGDQIRKYRCLKGLTQQEIANALGESSGRVIYNWEKGMGRPDCDKLAKLCKLLDVSADELIGITSISKNPTNAEWEFLQKYRTLDNHGKEVIDYMINCEYKRMILLSKKPKPRMIKIGWFPMPASAGTGNMFDADLAEDIYVHDTSEAERADFIISVCGDSMEPTYHDGDKVFVEKGDFVNIGEVGIFVVNGEVFIKERGANKLISHNPKYQSIYFSENDSIYCCGKVIGMVTK